MDSCGTNRPGNPIPICVASAGNPVTTVTPPTFTEDTANTFTVANPGAYSSITINFGDGTTATIPTSGANAGTTTHTYSKSGSFTYTVTAVDSCTGIRTVSTPVSVSPVSCVTTQPDGCTGSLYCTGITNCTPQGSCKSTCNLCGYTGTPVAPSTSCSGTQQCVTGGTTCNSTSNCSNVCGQCGYSGSPVTPVKTCNDGQQCVSGGTTCNPTSTCTTIPGQCGDPLPTPIPTPRPTPTAAPVAPTPTPTPTSTKAACAYTCTQVSQSCQGSSGDFCTPVTQVGPYCSAVYQSSTTYGGFCGCCGNAGNQCKTTLSCTSN